MVYYPAPSIFRWILHHYNLLTYSNDHRKNSSYSYIIFISLIYFYIIFHNSLKMMIYLTWIPNMRWEFQDQAIYIDAPQINWNFTFFDMMILYYCTGVNGIKHPGEVFPTVTFKPKYILINSLLILIHTSISNYDHS